MKSLMYMLVALIVLLSFESVYSQEYNQPKSIVYDAARSRYLISNKGSGQVLAISNTNVLSVFIDGQLSAPRGMLIVGDSLYIVDVTNLKGFNLSDGINFLDYQVDGAELLIDLTIDEENNIFITDIRQKKLFIYNLNDNKPLDPYSFSQATYPNGITYYKNKLYVTTYWQPAQIVVFDLIEWRETKHDFMYNNYFDGIVNDGNGNFYIASWEDMGAPIGKGKILKSTVNDITNLIEIKSGLDAPGDIYYNPIKNELAVPEFSGDSVIFIPLSTDVFENKNDHPDIEIYNNDKNKEMTIKFNKNYHSESNIFIYNILGEPVKTIPILKEQDEIIVSTSNLNTGLYIIRINSNIVKLLINN